MFTMAFEEVDLDYDNEFAPLMEKYKNLMTPDDEVCDEPDVFLDLDVYMAHNFESEE